MKNLKKMSYCDSFIVNVASLRLYPCSRAAFLVILMFRKSAEAKRLEKIHKLKSNGNRFVAMRNGDICAAYRYKYQCKLFGVEIIDIDTLIY